jgi:hypothetical protein
VLIAEHREASGTGGTLRAVHEARAKLAITH